jgi:hypothetical protein
VTNASGVQHGPRFVVVTFAGERAELPLQGSTPEAVFRRLFLDPYGMEGERHRPGEGAVVHGVLVATWESAVVTVPIWSWTGVGSALGFLCQASDDGRPPAISVVAATEAELLDRLGQTLRPTAGP